MARLTDEEKRKRHAAYQKEYRLRHPERVKQARKRYVLSRVEQFNAYQRLRMKRNGKRSLYSRTSRAKHHEKTMAWAAVYRAINKSGLLVRPGRCDKCGLACVPQAHHGDYSKKLDVQWLCRPCHLATKGYRQRVSIKGDPVGPQRP